MKVISVPIDDVIPYETNPRHNDQAVDAVARSIEEFGFRQPIVVTEDYMIIVGHTRWKAAQAGSEDRSGPRGQRIDAGTDSRIPHRGQ